MSFADELRAAVLRAEESRVARRPAKQARLEAAAQPTDARPTDARPTDAQPLAPKAKAAEDTVQAVQTVPSSPAHGGRDALASPITKKRARELLRQSSFEERLDAFVGNYLQVEDPIEDIPLPAEEQARERFAARLRLAKGVDEASLPSMLGELRTEGPKWGSTRHQRSVALLLVYVSRSSRVCRGAFVAQGLPLLGELLTQAVQVLEAGPDTDRHEAGLQTVACLTCLSALAVGRATMWEHRQILGKAFDRLHRWCNQEKTALAAELRALTQSLSRMWRQQPKPAVQDTPANKALRVKVLELIRQGLEDGGSVGSVASEIEAALYSMYAGATSEYRQHARMLRHNMMQPENGALRRRILTGEIGAQELVRMDSRSLAPETLQEKRRREELEALKSVVIAPAKNVAPAPPAFDWRDETYNPSASRDEARDEGAVRQAEAEAGQMPESPAEFMEQPTPLRSSSASGAPATPEAMATPAPDDEDEQRDDLIRHFSQRVL